MPEELRPYDQGEFKNKSVLISGGSSGIGLETARLFVKEGARVGIIDKGDTPDFLDKKLFRRVDVTDYHQVEENIGSLTSALEGLDIVVNGAALKIPGNILNLSLEDLEAMMRVNGLGFLYVIRCVLPRLKISEGTLINLCSATSESLPANTDGYFSTKAVTFGATNAIFSTARENHWNVRIAGIGFGPVDTPLWRKGQPAELIQSALSGQWNGPKVWTPEQAASYVLNVASHKNRNLESHLFRP